MATFNKFNQFVEDKNHGVHNLGSDSIKVMLTNTAPVATNTVFTDIVDITPGNGYVAGGATSAVFSSEQVSGVYKLVLTDVPWTAAVGTIGPFRYVVLYNDTPTSPADPLIGWIDYGSAITLAPTESFTVDFDPSSGVITDV